MAEKNIPEKFFKMAIDHPTRTLFKVKEGAAWREIPWAESAEAIAEIANGFLSLGMNAGDRVSLLSENRLEWIYADLGILAAAGVTVTIYPSNLPSEIEYIVNNSGSRFIIVSDQGQSAKLKDRSKNMPEVEKIISLDDLGSSADDVISLAKLRELGRKYAAANPDALAKRYQSIKIDELCTMVYTSGTTGPPKGAMITHGNILYVHEASTGVLQLHPDSDHALSILPYAHVYERIGGLFNGIFAKVPIALCQGLDKIVANVGEIRPTFILGAPRLYEKMYGAILKNIESQSPFKKKVFVWAMSVGKEATPYRLTEKPLPVLLNLKYQIANKMVFSTIKQRFGGRIRFFVSAAAPISPEIIEFFSSLDIIIIEGWGMTETSAPSTMNRPPDIRFGSVGKVLPGVDVKIADDGEVMVKGPNLFMGYWSKDGPIRDEFAQDGYFHTGDVGRIDEEGFLYITDRKKDIIITGGGKNISPQNIENTLKTDMYISEALVSRRCTTRYHLFLEKRPPSRWAALVMVKPGRSRPSSSPMMLSKIARGDALTPSKYRLQLDIRRDMAIPLALPPLAPASGGVRPRRRLVVNLVVGRPDEIAGTGDQSSGWPYDCQPQDQLDHPFNGGWSLGMDRGGHAQHEKIEHGHEKD